MCSKFKLDVLVIFILFFFRKAGQSCFWFYLNMLLFIMYDENNIKMFVSRKVNTSQIIYIRYDVTCASI